MKDIFKNIFKILNRRESKKFRTLILFDVAISILDIFFLAMLLFIIRFYTDPSSFSLPSYFPTPLKNQYNLLVIIIFFILFSVKNFFGFVIMRKQQKFVYDIAARLSKKQMQNYQDGSYTDYVNIDSSVHIRKISQLPIEFGHYVLGGLQQIISQSILIFITIVAIFIYNPVLLPLLFVILGPPLILIGILMKKKLIQIRQSAKTASEKTLQHVKEALSGFIESNVFESKNFFADRYEASQIKFNNFLSEQQVIQNMPSRLIEIFAILGLLVLIVINSFASPYPGVQVITIGAFMAAAYKIIPGIVKILNSQGQIKTYSFTITELLQKKEPITVPHKRNKNPSLHYAEFKNVSFSYNGEVILRNFSFCIARGKIIGLTGKSGKGKTTIINLLLGFIDEQEGSIHLNGIATISQERKEFWKNIAYVKQQSFFIHDTILKNIILDENNVNEEKLKEVTEITGLAELLDKYPEGIEKIITENGKNISGGQRQRIAIARALYKEADLIILDEPFNELDEASELMLVKHFKKIAGKGKMVILITHNLMALSFCNKTISLDEA